MAKKKVRWGFKWPQVISGLGMLAVGGGVGLVGWLSGYIVIWAVVTAVIGLFTLLSGLIGEEGVW
jgi:hypothetical protein